jgi:outer membrane receptor for monomeric catechols
VLDGNSSLGGGVVVLPASARAAIDPGIGVGELTSSTPVDQALQATLGTRWHSRRGLELGAAGFLRYFTDDRVLGVVADGSVTASYPYFYEIESASYGAEFLVRQRIGNRLYAWAAYTLMRSQARAPATPVTPGGVAPGAYDQRHNLVLVASYALPRGFRIGGRFRLVSGAPFTPIVGALSTDYGYEPVNGGTNSARFPIFHQLDLRLDKSWVLRRSVVLAYVDVQNVYNHENVEAYVYAYDYRERVGQVGLPILPTIGVRVEW